MQQSQSEIDALLLESTSTKNYLISQNDELNRKIFIPNISHDIISTLKTNISNIINILKSKLKTIHSCVENYIPPNITHEISPNPTSEYTIKNYKTDPNLSDIQKSNIDHFYENTLEFYSQGNQIKLELLPNLIIHLLTTKFNDQQSYIANHFMNMSQPYTNLNYITTIDEKRKDKLQLQIFLEQIQHNANLISNLSLLTRYNTILMNNTLSNFHLILVQTTFEQLENFEKLHQHIPDLTNKRLDDLALNLTTNETIYCGVPRDILKYENELNKNEILTIIQNIHFNPNLRKSPTKTILPEQANVISNHLKNNETSK